MVASGDSAARTSELPEAKLLRNLAKDEPGCWPSSRGEDSSLADRQSSQKV